MPLRNILHKKERINDINSHASDIPAGPVSPVPEIRFYRTDTNTEEVISPPVYDEDDRESHSNDGSPQSRRPRLSTSSSRKGLNLFHRSRSPSDASSPASPTRPRRLSQLLNLGHGSRNSSSTSVNVPSDLPQINYDNGDEQDRQAQWEKRATVLVQQNPHFASPPSLSPSSSYGNLGPDYAGQSRSRSNSRGHVNDPQGDVNIQEAIRLHEAGELERSTEMFGQLADPNGANNALSQVLYGLALRHGWGCVKNEEQAVTYLSAAASNSASIESEALHAGIKKGGAAKGELVLAIFELANCFRNGWGVQKDPVAARQYYETAANLGDTDAMNEVAWCYLEGFGGKKDKYMAAKYYRLAEEHGNKIIGNSWIWKEKYNPK